MSAGDTMNEVNGGARRDRTDDLMLAKHALSQLSYGPMLFRTRQRCSSRSRVRAVAARGRACLRFAPDHKSLAKQTNSNVTFISDYSKAPRMPRLAGFPVTPAGSKIRGRVKRRCQAFLSRQVSRTHLAPAKRFRDRPFSLAKRPLVGRGGLEPPTSRLSGVRSNHLSYRPISLGTR